MPVNNLKQAVISMSRAQMEEVGKLAETPGGRQGCRIEETNLGNTIAVITIPGKKIHMIAWGGEVHEMGHENA